MNCCVLIDFDASRRAETFIFSLFSKTKHPVNKQDLAFWPKKLWIWTILNKNVHFLKFSVKAETREHIFFFCNFLENFIKKWTSNYQSWNILFYSHINTDLPTFLAQLYHFSTVFSLFWFFCDFSTIDSERGFVRNVNFLKKISKFCKKCPKMDHFYETPIVIKSFVFYKIILKEKRSILKA